MKPSFYNLYQDTFLLINITSFALHCVSKRTQSSCSFCLLDIPRTCSFQTANFAIPVSTPSEEPDIIASHPKHIVNLAVLLYLFDEDQLKTISGDSFFHTIPNISIPPFTFYTHALATNLHLHLDLKRMLETVKQHHEIFAGQTKKLTHFFLLSLEFYCKQHQFSSDYSCLTFCTLIIKCCSVLRNTHPITRNRTLKYLMNNDIRQFCSVFFYFEVFHIFPVVFLHFYNTDNTASLD